MKLKLFLSIMAVSLMTVSASEEALDTNGSGNEGPTAAVRQRHSAAATSPKGSAKPAEQAKQGGVLAKVAGVFTGANAKAGATQVVKTGAVVVGTAVTADAYALATTGAAYGCSTFFGTNLATVAATSLTSLPMVTLPTGAVIVGGVVLLPTAAVAMKTINGLLPEKLKFKKTERFLTSTTAWGLDILATAAMAGYMMNQQPAAKVGGGSAPKSGNPTPGGLSKPGK